MKIKIVKPKIWNFKIVNGKNAWQEVVYSARMSGVPKEIQGQQVFRMLVKNDYGSALEHIIIKFDIKMTKGNAPELLEHRIASHSGYSTRFIKADQGIEKKEFVYEIILPWHLIKTQNSKNKKQDLRNSFLGEIRQSIKIYEELLNQGIPRESARYVLPFCSAVGIYHFTINLRSLLNLISLRLCVRTSPEFRCLASQLYFLLIKNLPVIKGFAGCRGFIKGVCPENDITGVRKGDQHKVYPPCIFKNSDTDIFIPTMKEIQNGIKVSKFKQDKAIKIQEQIFKKWACWQGGI